MDNFRDSYFQVDWDLTSKRLKGTFWGKQYDTGRGFAVTVINGGQVVTPSNEVLRLKWEKPDNTTGYVNATIVDGKFIVENIDQMFTVHGSVRADFELSVAGEFVASITFYVSVEKAVAVDAVASSSEFTALQTAISTVDGIDEVKSQLVQIEQQLEDGTAGIDDNIVSESKVWSSAKTQEKIQTAVEIFPKVYVSLTEPPNLENGDVWVKPIVTEDVLPTDYFMRFDAMELSLSNNERVAEWQDLSGNGNHVSQSNTSYRPIFTSNGFNGKPAVRFIGANAYYLEKENFELDSVSGATIFIVGQLENVVKSEAFINIGNEGANQTAARKFVIKTSNSAQAFQVQINSGAVYGQTSADLNPFLFASSWDGSENKIYKNGKFATQASYVGGLEPHSKMTIGRSLYTANPERLDGVISEIIYFSRGLSEVEISLMNAYLLNKWGL